MEEAIEFVLRRLKYEHIFFSKMVQFGAIWCILGPILASISLLFLRLFFFKMLPLQTSLKTKKKKNLKCDLMQACTPSPPPRLHPPPPLAPLPPPPSPPPESASVYRFAFKQTLYAKI